MTDNSQDKNNIAAVVVAYNPDLDFTSRLKKIQNQFNLTIIVDNSSSPEAAELEHNTGKVIVIRNRKNLGLGYALNQGCEMAIEKGYTWCTTFDQDSLILDNFISEISDVLSTNASIRILGCNYLLGNNQGSKFFHESPLRKVTTVITSGTTIHLPTWKSLGMFREDFFIDAIDHEFCLRASCKNFKLAPMHSSEIRKYTIARNSVVTALKYRRSHLAWATRKILSLSFDFLSILFFEPKKYVRCKLFILGVVDGLRGNMTRYEL